MKVKEPKVDTRELIIRKSAELFNLRGYNGCSMSDIMEATQLKKGGIYNYFKSKEEIAVEAYKYSYKVIMNRFRERLDCDVTSFDKLNSVIDVYASFIEVPFLEGGCPIFNTAMDATDEQPVLKEHAKRGIASLQRYIEIKVDEGIQNCEFKPECDPKRIASLMIINLEGAIIMWRVQGTSDHMNLASSFLKDYLESCRL